MRARYRWMPCGVLAALCFGAVPAAEQESPPIELTIEMRDLARVPSDVMRKTKAAVDRTFRASGVRIVWVDPTASPQSSASLKLYVIGGTMTGSHSEASGATVVGLAPESGNWAQVFYGRVAAAVAERPISISVVLAHVISHELGHLLLPPNSHSPFGVMRRAVDLEHPSLRRFTGEQSRLIRDALSSGRRYAWPCGQSAPDGTDVRRLTDDATGEE